MKTWGKRLGLVTAMLCLFLISGIAGFKSHAATAGDLYSGSSFNSTLKSFVNSNAVYYSEDKTIKKIVFMKSLDSKIAKNMKKKTVGNGIAAYYDSKNKVIYVCYSKKINFDKSCSSMFRGFAALETVEFGSGIVDTSRMTETAYMFCNCYNLKTLNLGAFNTQNVFDMQYMFLNCRSLSQLNIGSFNTSKVVLMNSMFRGCSKLGSLNLSGFKTTKVTDVQYMFFGCTGLVSANLSSFNMTNVAEDAAVGFLGACPYLVYVDAPGVIDRDFGYDDNPSNLANCSIGKAAIDDNYDGKPDSSGRYSVFIQSRKTHRYIFLDAIEKFKKIKGSNFNPSQLSGYKKSTGAAKPNNNSKSAPQVKNEPVKVPSTVVVNGVIYNLGADGTATVIYISDVKKASINTVAANGRNYSVIRIEENACKGNKKIKSLKIGSNVQSIGKKAFYGCRKLKKVSIKANKSLKVEKDAFKKIGKHATVTLKGVKGKTRKKIAKSIGGRVR